MITRAQRKVIREAGPYRFDNEGVLLGGVFAVAFSGDTERAVLDVLNEHVDTPESVAVARERLLRVASLDSSTGALIWTAAHAYQTALRAAKKTRKT